MNNQKHAKLSASGSERWLNCPGSVKAEENYASTSSPFAQEGTLAHELAEVCLREGTDPTKLIGTELSGKIITEEMAYYVREYQDYVESLGDIGSLFYVEERVDFSNIVPEGFGTIDCAIIDTKSRTCHIVDLKYGKGEMVYAKNNTQAQLYALGLLNELGFLDSMDSFNLHIVQPRLKHFDNWKITKKELQEFGKFVSDRAKLALSKDATKNPGKKQCRWCKAAPDCKALADYTKKIITKEFDELDEVDPSKLTDTEKRNILDNKKLIESFLKKVQDSVFERIKSGETFEGYKIVEGRSNRKWTDKAEALLKNKFGEDIYDKKLKGITTIEKQFKNDINIKDYVYKPEGSPTLVPDSDKRQPINFKKIEDQFDKI